jgi:hypothetical protein
MNNQDSNKLYPILEETDKQIKELDNSDISVIIDTNNIEKQLDTKTDSNEKQLDTKIDSNEKQSDTKIDSNEKQLDTKIDSNEKQLDNKTDSNEKQLDTKTDSNEKQSDTKIDSNEKQLDTKTDSNEKQLDTKTDSNEKQLDTKTDNFDNKTDNFDDKTDNFDNKTDNNDSIDDKTNNIDNIDNKTDNNDNIDNIGNIGNIDNINNKTDNIDNIDNKTDNLIINKSPEQSKKTILEQINKSPEQTKKQLIDKSLEQTKNLLFEQINKSPEHSKNLLLDKSIIEQTNEEDNLLTNKYNNNFINNNDINDINIPTHNSDTNSNDTIENNDLTSPLAVTTKNITIKMRNLFNNNKLNELIHIYEQIDCYIENIEEDIKHLIELHKTINNNVQQREKFNNYGIYSDDIYFQKNILKSELNLIKFICESGKKKLYGDLFRIFTKVIKNISSLKLEYTEIKTSYKTINKNFIENNIKLYSVINNTITYTNKDIIHLYKHICIKLQELETYINKVDSIISLISNKHSNGYAVRIMILGILGEKDKLILEFDTTSKILDATIDLNINISQKYLVRSKILSKEIKDNTSEVSNHISNTNTNN